MSVETDDDLDGFFDPDDFGEAATYTPAGQAGIAVVVIMTRGDEIAPIAGLGIQGARRLAYLRRSEVDAPARGDTLTVGSETYTVQVPSLDELGKLWTLDLSLNG